MGGGIHPKKQQPPRSAEKHSGGAAGVNGSGKSAEFHQLRFGSGSVEFFALQMMQEIGSGFGKVFGQIGGEAVGIRFPDFADAPGRVSLFNFFMEFFTFPFRSSILGQRFEKLAMATVDIRIGHGFFPILCCARKTERLIFSKDTERLEKGNSKFPPTRKKVKNVVFYPKQGSEWPELAKFTGNMVHQKGGPKARLGKGLLARGC